MSAEKRSAEVKKLIRLSKADCETVKEIAEHYERLGFERTTNAYI